MAMVFLTWSVVVVSESKLFCAWRENDRLGPTVDVHVVVARAIEIRSSARIVNH